MAKTKKEGQSAKKATDQASQQTNGHAETPEQLYTTAVELAEQSQPEEALAVAQKLLTLVQTKTPRDALPALNLLGEISLELGEAEQAREYFQRAAQIDPAGELEGPLGGGAEKFLWLAQLCEDGGRESVAWFEKGATALQRDISMLDNATHLGLDEDTLVVVRAEKKAKLANALCGIVEVYMTDLSWDDDAEEKCENLITQAMTVEDETSPEVLQTLASVRLSQDRKDDARAALQRSYGSWKDLDADDEDVPEFAARISLARLLMEADLEDDAMDVLDRLVLEDDQSVEAWYLGGWCQWLLADKSKIAQADPEDIRSVQKGSRRWLKTALRLYDQLDYEDDRLKDHAQELVTGLDAALGPENEEDENQWEEEWDGIAEQDGVEDEEMQDV
ncbi:hypothetical protein AMS68_007594 [Peltaster fructicola]|uniref:Uncharacterized protein n=1 Tax=Peltaster fructicola TaxID=286661 RepID=A0A6H0Y4W0_9PEZI|nr:hypothetical protein AMS68_007594 [Peltaster fructicola]